MTENDEVQRVEPDEMPIYDPMSDLMQKLDEMESQENASFRVYRQHSGNTSKMSFLFTVPADQFQLEELLSKIRDEYGAGDYRLHLRGPTEAGRNQVIANRVFSIEAPKGKEPERAPETNPLAAVVEKMDARMERLEERLLERHNQPAQQSDPMDMLEKMMGMMVSMKSIMPDSASNPAPPQKSLVEQMQELRELQELAGDLGGGESSGFSALIRDGLKPMMDLMKEDAQARKEAREKGIPYKPPEDQATPARKNPAPTTPDEIDEGTKAMLSNVKTLLSAAQRGGDPETYAEIVLDFVPEEKYTELYNFLSLPESIDTLVYHFPQAAQYREWFTSLRASILAQLEAVDGPDEPGPDGEQSGQDAGPDDLAGDTGGTGGDAGDVAGDGEDGEGGEDAAADSQDRHADHRTLAE